MNVTITTNQLPKRIIVSCDKPDVVSWTSAKVLNVSVSMVKTGRDGLNGKDAFELWLIDNPDGTIEDYHEFYRGAPGLNAENNTLEKVRVQDANVYGNIKANGNTIEGLRNAIDDKEPLTKAQGDAILQAAKEHADATSAITVRSAGFWDPTGGIYPNGTIGGVKFGYQYEAINVDIVTMPDGTEIESGDLFRARITNPGQNPANWYIGQGNTQQATEIIQGTAKVITQAEAQNENTVNDKDILTGVKAWFLLSRFKAIAQTISGLFTFTTSPRINTVTVNQWLKSGASKEIVSIDKIPAADITEGVDKLFLKASERLLISGGMRVWLNDANDYTASLIGERPFVYYPFAANTWRVGSKIEIEVAVDQPIASANGKILLIGFNNSASIVGRTSICSVNAAANISNMRLKFEGVIKPGNILEIYLQPTTSTGQGTITTDMIKVPFDPTTMKYFYCGVIINDNTATFRQSHFGIKGIY